MSPSLATGTRVAFAFALSNPGPPVPDGDGGYTSTPVPLGPGLVCGSVTPMTKRQDYEHGEVSTTIAHASSIVIIPFVAGVTTATVLAWTDRGGVRHTANVLAVVDCADHAFSLELHVIEVAA